MGKPEDWPRMESEDWKITWWSPPDSQPDDINWPQRHIEFDDFWHDLEPESANRILNMVEREQDYERLAKKSQYWTSASEVAVRFLGIVVLILISIPLIAAIAKAIEQDKLSLGLALSAGSFAAGAGVVVVILNVFQLRKSKPRIPTHRSSETPGDSRRAADE